MKRNKRTNCVSGYEYFKSLPNESFNDKYNIFSKILNELRKYGVTKSNDEKNVKFLGVLPREWKPLTIHLVLP